MPTIEHSDRFIKYLKKVTKQLHGKVAKTICLLAENPAHPSLRSKPVRGAPGIYEASVEMNYRITYERLEGDVLRLRVIGTHDDALRNP